MMDYDYYKVYLFKDNLFQMKIVIENIEVLSELLNEADPDVYDRYLVIGHFFCTKTDNVICSGSISQPATRKVYK